MTPALLVCEEVATQKNLLLVHEMRREKMREAGLSEVRLFVTLKGCRCPNIER